MAHVVFTSNLQRHVNCPATEADGDTVREVLDTVFEANKPLRSYVLDDQQALRRHMVVFVDNKPVLDRRHLSDRVAATSEVYVMQALSGG